MKEQRTFAFSVSLRVISFDLISRTDGAGKKHHNVAMACMVERSRIADRELDRNCSTVLSYPPRCRNCCRGLPTMVERTAGFRSCRFRPRRYCEGHRYPSDSGGASG